MPIKGPGEKPFVPPINPKDSKPEKTADEKLNPQPLVKAPTQPGIGRGPELDAHAIATRMAIMAAMKRSSSALVSDSVGSTIRVPATGKLTVGAWKP